MKPLLIGTGLTRGIGLETAKKLSAQFRIVSLTRRPTQTGFEEIIWDLEKSWTENNSEPFTKLLKEGNLQGFIHCAGLLGPIGHPDVYEQEPQAYWHEYRLAMRVNHENALELTGYLLPYLMEKENKKTPPFLMHLSSGAAKNAYVGWDAYCASKASVLMAFQCLAKRYTPQELLVLSIMPGTVYTDMMKTVLSANPDVFPDLTKFETLRDTGGLVSPESVGEKIAKILTGTFEEMSELHGKAFDLRTLSSK